ncbi:hypothetical protein [Nocardia alni]|uniref:hypothetical protein n=1 Tax=Nocardia alni TaxID=2815723 RepID=UPI001C223A81|nr:hypothetical protein [Nocardia alni]
MWEWSRTVAERAAAAVQSSWQSREPRPTVVDPEPWREQADRGDRHDGANLDSSDMVAYILAG